jgi:hypothetical protein
LDNPQLQSTSEEKTMAEAQQTQDHDTIRQWAETRGGSPATVTATVTDDEAGLLRIDFPGYSGEDTLARISWEEFFDKFDEENLTFLYQDETDNGDVSRFCKFIRS